MTRGQHGHIAGGDDHPLQHILELAHVARPSTAREPLQQRRLDGRDGASAPVRQPAQDRAGQIRHVLSAIPQRRHDEVADVQAIVQVLAEPAFRDRSREVDVCRREHADVERGFVTGAEPLHRTRLQGAEQAGLQLEREIAHFVEQDRAAIRPLERAGALVDGARERAADMPEQRVFRERRRQRAAVDDDERRVGTRRGAMNRAGDAFLAGAGFTRNHGGDVRVAGHAEHLLLQRPDRRRRAVDLRKRGHDERRPERRSHSHVY